MAPTMVLLTQNVSANFLFFLPLNRLHHKKKNNIADFIIPKAFLQLK